MLEALNNQLMPAVAVGHCGAASALVPIILAAAYARTESQSAAPT
ncbi:MAG: hypothetical protein ABIU95_01895 [Burkholderiales bacterium]